MYSKQIIAALAVVVAGVQAQLQVQTPVSISCVLDSWNMMRLSDVWGGPDSIVSKSGDDKMEIADTHV